MSESTPTATDQHVLITRVFDAPRERVFRAWLPADMAAAVDAARATYLDAARRRDTGLACSRQASVAKSSRPMQR